MYNLIYLYDISSDFWIRDFLSGTPTCRCLAGFTGPNCNKPTCLNYCKNGGNCTVSRGNQPTCSCLTEYLGDQCQYSECDTPHTLSVSIKRPSFHVVARVIFVICKGIVFSTGKCDGPCDNGGTCMKSSDGSRQCRCPPQFIGNNCEVDKCHYCHNGKCIPTNLYQPHGDVTCRYTISHSIIHLCRITVIKNHKNKIQTKPTMSWLETLFGFIVQWVRIKIFNSPSFGFHMSKYFQTQLYDLFDVV